MDMVKRMIAALRDMRTPPPPPLDMQRIMEFIAELRADYAIPQTHG